ncbi:Hcr1p [Sugiyamaella lignohabitans]|uniref:Eukaryotic translation initiation factor 3 subunit J n=1 Tax=Sugiyamaella lignohabitans TaxID=796027 RepID=A0A167CFU6_9ASCO|nr:Hcr1p [Sugiyamaella lignohabitans]ANB11634.1 Hcr1p [Sugiyamaella lignohabitans]
MSNWDDEDYEVPVSAVQGKFDDEEEDGVLDDWEAAGESEEESTPAGPTRVRVPMAQRVAEREKKEQEAREKAALAKSEEDAAAKKERLRKAEVDSDLNNAAALFGAVDIHPRAAATANANAAAAASAATPGKLSDLTIFKPNTKAEFDALRKTLVPILTDLSEKSTLQFANFITDFVRDVCKPLTSDQARKVTSTLNALTNDKQREERASRGKKKPKPIAKDTSLKIDAKKDTTNYDEFDDDDFM